MVINIISIVMVCLCSLVCVFAPLCGTAVAQDSQNSGTEIMEELDAVQSELGEADVPLTHQQWQEILQLNAGSGKLAIHGKPSTFGGMIGWRQQWVTSTGSASTSRINMKGKGAHFKLRQVARSMGQSESGGYLLLEKGKLVLGVGDYGINHGFGLLKAGPGRGAYLAADNRLGMKSQGMRKWAGGFDSGAVRGGSLYFKSSEKWDALFVVGSVRASGKESGQQIPVEKMVRLSGLSKGVAWGVLAAGSGRDIGLSISGKASGSGLQASWEFAGWRAGAESVLPAFAWAMAAGLDPKRNWVLEGFLVATDGTGFLTGGHLPFIPAGEGGRGWFVRTGRRVSGVGKLLVVVGKMKHRTATGTGQRHSTTLLDFQGRWLVKPGIEISGRWRRRQRNSEKWSSIYPWQAPFVAGQELRSVVTSQIAWKSPPLTVRILARLYQQGKDANWGTRSLLSGSVTYWLGNETALKVTNATAWGDPIDLVSAVSPMAGLVLPRHWGSWREETTFGLRSAWKFLHGRVGVSRRTPESWNTGGVNISFWGEGSFRW